MNGLEDVRALTVRQPWASLLVEGIKTIETRTWSTSYRGKLVIHAGKATIGEQLEFATASLLWREGVFMPAEATRWLRDVPLGAIVGTVDLVNVVPALEALKIHPTQDRWGEFREDTFGWVVENPRPMSHPLHQCGGRQGLWAPARHGVDLQGIR